MPEEREKSKFSFGEFHLEVLVGAVNTVRNLYREGSAEALKIQQRSLQVLEYFLRHPGKPLRRDDICRAVWEDAEGDLAPHVGPIRAALKDDPDHPRYIKNVRKYGF